MFGFNGEINVVRPQFGHTVEQCGPSSNSHFLHIFIFSADLDILDCQAWVPTQNEVLRIDKGHEQFRAGRLCLMSSA